MATSDLNFVIIRPQTLQVQILPIQDTKLSWRHALITQFTEAIKPKDLRFFHFPLGIVDL